MCGRFDILYACISIIPKNQAESLQYVRLTLSNSYLKLINLQNTNLSPMTRIIARPRHRGYYLSGSNGSVLQNVIFQMSRGVMNI